MRGYENQAELFETFGNLRELDWEWDLVSDL